MKERSIYIHIPFCRQKCNYCSFKSVLHTKDNAINYVASLVKEIAASKDLLKQTKIKSIYIGGGTPSVISLGEMYKIINEVKKYTRIDNEEFTIEVNPESVDETKIYGYKALGMNRLSIGLQSIDNKVLKTANRVHTYEMFLNAMKIIKKQKIKNINIDIMVGLAGSTKENVMATVKEALKQKPKHISAYMLMCEEGTPLKQLVDDKKTVLPTDDEMMNILRKAQNKIEKSGFKRYEISNFAKRGYESIHNRNYWNQGEYFGFGMGAVAYINGKRSENISSMEDYLNGNFKYDVEEISADTLKTEKIMLGLRTNAGIPISVLSEEKQKFLPDMEKAGLIKIKNDVVTLTNAGFNVSNQIIVKLI